MPTTPVWIGLGSNLGDRQAALDAAIEALGAAPGVVVQVVSSYHETRPVGGPPGQGAFLNAAARIATTLDPFALLEVTQGIEDSLGRVREVRWGERTLDLDLLIYGTRFLDTSRLKLPHPRLAFRRFVLAPLAEIAPAIVDTVSGRTIADLLVNLGRKPRLLALEGPPGSLKLALFRRLVEEMPAVGIEGDEVGRPSDNSDDPVQAHLGRLGRRIEALRADLYRPEASPAAWIAADYCLLFDLMEGMFSNPDAIADAMRVGQDWKLAFFRARPSLIDAVKLTISPTIVVMMPDSIRSARRPGYARFPMLWPESNEPDAIVAEIVATCRGIEGI